MKSSQRGSFAVLALAVGLLVAILATAVQASRAAAGPGGRAAELVPASALAYARLSTDPDDPAARALARLAPKVPGYERLREQALSAISPAPGAFDLRRDVRPWLGDEAAVALIDLGGGRFGSLVIAEVRNRPRAEALLQRVAGARPAARYGKTVVRRFGANAAAFVKGFLVAGPELAVQRSIDAARGERPRSPTRRVRARARGRAAGRRVLRLGAAPARDAGGRRLGRGRRAARPPRPRGLGRGGGADSAGCGCGCARRDAPRQARVRRRARRARARRARSRCSPRRTPASASPRPRGGRGGGDRIRAEQARRAGGARRRPGPGRHLKGGVAAWLARATPRR